VNTALILSGGTGSRIGGNIPKQYIEICGKPILEYQIECLKKQNLTDIILVIGHLGNVIEEYFKEKENRKNEKQ